MQYKCDQQWDFDGSWAKKSKKKGDPKIQFFNCQSPAHDDEEENASLWKFSAEWKRGIIFSHRVHFCNF